ncbi:MAG: hypothetical protein E7773_14580 [Sphingomonas sp.]|uniref:PRC-barrel domain-containing protein n=1 Tax=Sphingomonas sp. TaxID=28214 RepID=UPI001216BDCB|nr:PRC-barrel domain-containing protein [Sphingomonas sp.]THD34604.1 MAG: hypothetical protein E7773_14580 [Sphingomonas sp.]
MKASGSLKLLSGLRDLQIVDADGVKCGIVDEIEFDGEPGKRLAIANLVVGPGALRSRLSAWIYKIVIALAGERAVRVPWAQVESVTSVVKLRASGRSLGLTTAEDRARSYVPRRGAL